MFESALVAGLLSIGVEAIQFGGISSPGVSYLPKTLDAQAGVMMSAPHNPVGDNGIKFFGSDGFKLLDAQEEEIELLLDQENDELPRPIAIIDSPLPFIESSLYDLNEYVQLSVTYSKVDKSSYSNIPITY